MKTIHGDIFEYMDQGLFDVVIHGCNCFNTMGNGIAKQFKTKYPEVYHTDLKTIKGDKTKLGNYSFKYIKTNNEHEICIINAYTQYHYGGGINVNYTAIRNVFQVISKSFPKTSRIGYPKIGCGLAKGNWNIVSNIIDGELKDFDHTLVEFK